jgi:hypothetical protein
VLVGLRPVVPYDEFTIHHNMGGGGRSLVIWFVDKALDPLATGDGLTANFEAAVQHAIELGALLRSQDECVLGLFDSFNPIVVDGDYNGWLSGTIDPAELPPAAAFSDAELERAKAQLNVGYRQDRPTASHGMPPPPAGACTWTETEQKLRQHIGPSRQNVSFYYVLDIGGVNVWAQWDGPVEPSLFIPSLLNVVLELDCLYPAPNRLLTIVVDEAGALGMIGVVEGDVLTSGDMAGVIEQFRILYP